MQLTEAVKRRLSPAHVEPDKDMYVAIAITESIRAWMKELKSKHQGRFPNDVRAAYRAVHQAVATACNDPRYKGIQDEATAAGGEGGEGASAVEDDRTPHPPSVLVAAGTFSW